MKTLLLKKLFIFVSMMLMSWFAQAQTFQLEPCTNCTSTYPTYQAAVPLSSSDITEDYGRREANSRWHRGVDINGGVPGADDRGYHILSIAAGTIQRIYQTGYKVIAISGQNNQNFAYGHIFRDDDVLPQRSGDMVLATLTSHPNRRVIIYDPQNAADAYCLTDADLTQGNPADYFMTYTRTDGSVITFTTTGANRLTNQVQVGTKIAPVGGSVGFHPHVHLYNYVTTATDVLLFQNPDNHRNPLAFLNYNQPPQLTNYLDITRGNESAAVAGTGPFYGKINFKAKVLFHPQKFPSADRYTAASPIFDLNKVEVFEKGNSILNSYKLIKSAYFESKIDVGGIWGTSRYPSENNPVGNTFGGETVGGQVRGLDISENKYIGTASEVGYGDYRRTGIKSIAYSNGYVTGADNVSLAYDEFFFPEYETRIHKNDNLGRTAPQLAFRSEDARLPDGEHSIKAKSTTVRNVSFENTARTIHIDNFKPFVKSVNVSTWFFGVPSESNIVYERYWIFNGATNTQTLTPAETPNDLFEGQNFIVEASTSEPMSSVQFSIPSLGVNNQAMTSDMFKTRWQFVITGDKTTAATGSHQIYFSGTDHGGNNFVQNPTTIPYREFNAATNQYQWSNGLATGADSNHSFYIDPGTCAPNEGGRMASACEVIADFIHGVSPTNPLNIEFTDESTPPQLITSWSWNFGDPGSGSANTSTSRNPSHIFSGTGVYTVTLTVDDGTTFDTHTKYVTVDNTVVSVTFSASGLIGNAPFAVELAGSTNLSSVSSWEWVVTSTSGTGNYYFSPSQYSQNTNVTLTDSDEDYQIKLIVSNGLNAYSSSTQTIEVNSGTAPVPRFSWTGQPYVNHTVFFEDESFLDGSCTPGNSVWTISDPDGYVNVMETMTGSPYSYDSYKVGTHIVQLCVTDNENCGSRTECLTKTFTTSIKTNATMADFTASATTIKKGETIEFTNLTQDPNGLLQGVGWWFELDPNDESAGTDAATAADKWWSYTDPDFYPRVVTHRYNNPGTYKVVLHVTEAIGDVGGTRKTMLIEVQDNILYEMDIVTQANPISSLSLSGDYVAVFDTPNLSVLQRSGSDWNTVATLQRSSGPFAVQGKVVMDNSTVAFKTTAGIYIYEKPANGWANMSNSTIFIPTSDNIEPWDIDLSNGIIATIVKVSEDRAYVDIYKKVSGVWGTSRTQRIDMGVDAHDIALGQGTLVVKHVSSSPQRVDLTIFENDKINGFQNKQTISKTDIQFASQFDISGNTLLVLNRWPKEVYVYEKNLFTYPQTPDAVLTVTSSTLSTSGDELKIDMDYIGLKLGSEAFIFKKPYDGWHDMKETIRVKLSTESPWADIFEMDLNGNYMVIGGNKFDNWPQPDGKLYFFEIEPVFCDDVEVLDDFQTMSPNSISNQKGILTIGGGVGTQAIIDVSATGNFRAVQTTLKPGFHAKYGSTVTIKSVTCETF